MEVQQIAEYGAVGLAGALIILLYFVLKWVFRFFGNHVRHNTDAVTDLTVVMREVKQLLIDRNGKK